MTVPHSDGCDSEQWWADEWRAHTDRCAIVMDLVVRRGLSYADAIEDCERRAKEIAAPYLKVAELIRAEMQRSEEKACDSGANDG
jgi:hypothetical protein